MENYYPRTIINVIDDSQIPDVNIVTQSSPVVMTAFASPKGTEEMQLVSGQQFYTDYINSIGVDFDKYGQVLLQSENIIKTGGVLLAKRLVAEDATLANMSVVANVTTKQVQKVDANGNPVFKDPVTNEEIIAPGVLAAVVPDSLTNITNQKTKASTKVAHTTIIKKVSPKSSAAKTVVVPKTSTVNNNPVVIKPGNGMTTKTETTPVAKPASTSTGTTIVKPASTSGTTATTPVAKTGDTASTPASTTGTKPATTPTATNTPAPTSKETPVAPAPIPVMDTVVVVTFECNTTSGAYNMDNITPGIQALMNDAGTNGVYTYPLFTLTDIGRGVSEKSIRIVPSYQEAKSINTMAYNLIVMESGAQSPLETIPFTLGNNVLLEGTNSSVQTAINNTSQQVKCYAYESGISGFINKVAQLGDISKATAASLDLLFGKDINNSNANLIGYEVDIVDGINLQYAFGIDLDSGDNGAFGDNPIGTEAYETQLLNFFNGTYSTEIYDLDNYKIDLVLDACYPKATKRAIEALQEFRQDFEFMEDVGTGCYTLDDILAYADSAALNRGTSVYGQSFDIIDPHSMKQITVSMTYAISNLIVNHFKNGRTRPFAGELYSVTVPYMLKGTLNFLPKVTPNVNEKAILANANINYGSYFNQLFVLETLATHQEEKTQLSFSNNMFAIQEIIKAIRTQCPKYRYSFITGKDFTTYKNDVDRILAPFQGAFAALEMVYVEQPSMVSNKIYSAAIKVSFKDFVQTELFTIYALNDTALTSSNNSSN